MPLQTVLKYVPENPQWPDKDIVNLPKGLDMLPMFKEGTSVFKRMLSAPFVRRKYLHTKDHFNYIDCLDAWSCTPKNLVNDNASIPKVIPTNPDGIFAAGAQDHDMGYRFCGLYLGDGPGEPFIFTILTRKEIDNVFLTQNKKANKLPLVNEAAHKALDIFGGSNFNQRPIMGADWSKPVYSK